MIAGRTDQPLLVDGDDFTNAVGTARRDRSYRVVGHCVVLNQRFEDRLTIRKMLRREVENRRVQRFGARRKQHRLGKPAQGALRSVGDRRVWVRGELAQEHQQIRAFDGDHSLGGHHSGGAGAGGVAELSDRLWELRDRERQCFTHGVP